MTSSYICKATINGKEYEFEALGVICMDDAYLDFTRYLLRKPKGKRVYLFEATKLNIEYKELEE